MVAIGHMTHGGPLTVRMRKPADMHQHLRQGGMLALVAPMVAKRFSAAIIMPNTTPPMTDLAALARYKAEVMAAVQDPSFLPLMTLYLTDRLDPEAVVAGVQDGLVRGIKYYPRGLTTNSDSGVKDPASLWQKGSMPYLCLRALAETGGVLLLHAADGFAGNGEELDPYDQERHFLKETLPRVIDAHKGLKISVEHMSTAEGAAFMRRNGNERLGCSLTAHHLLLDRRDVFRGGFRPHLHWWPIIQPKEHKDELRKFAAEGHRFVWLGSDSAPHPVGKKETACCIGGVLMAHAGIELYVEAFEQMQALDQRFEEFSSINGPTFFGIAPCADEIVLEKVAWKVERVLNCSEMQGGGSFAPTRENQVVPFRLGEEVQWRLAA